MFYMIVRWVVNVVLKVLSDIESQGFGKLSPRADLLFFVAIICPGGIRACWVAWLLKVDLLYGEAGII